MKLHRHSPAELLERAGHFLERREAENNLILGICASLADGEMDLTSPPIAMTVEHSGEVQLVALHTPPQKLLLSTGSTDAATELGRAWESALSGVMGPSEVAAAFSLAWPGEQREVVQRMRVYRCTQLVAPAPIEGALRVANPSDAAFACSSVIAFNQEAKNPGTVEGVTRMVNELIDAERLFVWERDGELVSIATARQPTPHGIRIGYVFSPPRHRGRGYAGAVTAGATQAMFNLGYEFCFLFTDLANPTSNRIYQRLGYQPMEDYDVWQLSPNRRS
jgi:predicted GNAT family acetyltransferase